ncbi:hypothetical protein H6504_04285 [Candidatus Woesearchaeota archaeon]|nr:hypothetical protein [Candidatus Woesearchaeota archaeon]
MEPYLFKAAVETTDEERRTIFHALHDYLALNLLKSYLINSSLLSKGMGLMYKEYQQDDLKSSLAACSLDLGLMYDDARRGYFVLEAIALDNEVSVQPQRTYMFGSTQGAGFVAFEEILVRDKQDMEESLDTMRIVRDRYAQQGEVMFQLYEAAIDNI